ncbi:serine hydrolase domain-containing protein [Microbaculum marinum]|uniref:Serine hydrolase domain-containing protein n=1 Tax=Microbaculum marinum TaxID=1764581 RepID=A0AAW9RVE8_9HYPH
MLHRFGPISRIAVPAILLPLLTVAPGAKAGDVVSPDRDVRLIEALNGFLRLPDAPPGVVVTIRRGNSIEEYSAGLGVLPCSSAPCDQVRRPRATDSMRIASLAKTFSGAVALSLVSEGKLSLDDTIGKWLPDQPKRWHAVTLRQMLNHTSGLPDFAASRAFAEQVAAHPTDPPPPEDLLDFVRNEPLNFPPGTQYLYSNSDNIAVALMAEAASNRNYHKLLARKVFRRVGIRHTRLPEDVHLPKPFIHGYMLDGGHFADVSEVVDFGGYAWASGGIASTPKDLGKFVKAYVGGDLFGRKEQRQQRRFVEGAQSSPPGPGANSAGLALFRYETQCGTMLGHTGSILGYTQFIAASRNGKKAVTLAINSQVEGDLVSELRKVEELAICVARGRR